MIEIKKEFSKGTKGRAALYYFIQDETLLKIYLTVMCVITIILDLIYSGEDTGGFITILAVIFLIIPLKDSSKKKKHLMGMIQEKYELSLIADDKKINFGGPLSTATYSWSVFSELEDHKKRLTLKYINGEVIINKEFLSESDISFIKDKIKKISRTMSCSEDFRLGSNLTNLERSAKNENLPSLLSYCDHRSYVLFYA